MKKKKRKKEKEKKKEEREREREREKEKNFFCSSRICHIDDRTYFLTPKTFAKLSSRLIY